MSIYLYQGTSSPGLIDTITVGGEPFNLTGSSVEFKMRPIGSSTLTIEATATIVSAAGGQVRYDWAADGSDLSTPGDYVFWWSVTLGSGRVQDTPEFPLTVLPHGPDDSLAIRSRVRRLIGDGQPSGTEEPLGMVRLEDLSDQIPAAATPTQTRFQVRFTQLPTQGIVTAFVVPGTLVAYVDGASAEVEPDVDADRNGAFTLPSAPTSRLLVSYGWQYHRDVDLDEFIDQARAWMQETDLSSISDFAHPVLAHYAASLAMRALAIRCSQPNVRAGQSSADYSQVGEAYGKLADGLAAEARRLRSELVSPAEDRAPAAKVGAVTVRAYQPRR